MRTTLPPQSGLCPVTPEFSRNVDTRAHQRKSRAVGPQSELIAHLGKCRPASSISQKSIPDYAESWLLSATSGTPPRRRDGSPAAPRCWRLA